MNNPTYHDKMQWDSITFGNLRIILKFHNLKILSFKIT